jgi:hypothetical protein
VSLGNSLQYGCCNEGSMHGLPLTIPIVHAGVYKRGSSPHQKPSTAWMLWQRPHGWVYAVTFTLPTTACCVDRSASRSPYEALSSMDAAAEALWMGYPLLFQQYMLAFTREGVAPIRNLPQHGCCGRGPMDGFTPLSLSYHQQVCCVDRGGSRSPCETLSSMDAAAEAPWMDSRRVSHGLLLATRPTDTKKALK